MKENGEIKSNNSIYKNALGEYYIETYYGDNYWNRKLMKENIGTLENVFEKFKPMYKKEYLVNGRFYKERQNGSK